MVNKLYTVRYYFVPVTTSEELYLRQHAVEFPLAVLTNSFLVVSYMLDVHVKN